MLTLTLQYCGKNLPILLVDNLNIVKRSRSSEMVTSKLTLVEQCVAAGAEPGMQWQSQRNGNTTNHLSEFG